MNMNNVVAGHETPPPRPSNPAAAECGRKPANGRLPPSEGLAVGGQRALPERADRGPVLGWLTSAAARLASWRQRVTAGAGAAPAPATTLGSIVRREAPLFGAAGAFSLFINLLALAAPVYMLQVYDRVLTSRSVETLALLSAIALGALAAFAWLDSIRMQLLARAALHIETAAGARVLHRTVGAASLCEPIYRDGLRDLRALRNLLAGAGCVALIDIPWCPLFIVIIGLFHPLLGAVALAGVATLLLLAWLDDRISRGAVVRALACSRRAQDLADEAIAQADVVRALGMHAGIVRRSLAAGERAARETLRAGRASSRVLALSKLLRQGMQVVMLALGAWLVIRQQASPGVMIAATILLARAMAPIEAAISGWRAMIEAHAATARVAAFLAQPTAAAPMALPAPQGALAVERVTLAAAGNEPILKGISFALQPGQALGLIGPSGAGKSMLGRVLVGALPPSSGDVRLDGAPWPQWDAERLGAHIGYLPQDVQLFEGSVAENIARFGALDAQRIVQAARLAGVHETILRLPLGYETRLGARGVRLSSGQRQMVGLARALYGEPRLVVLDEPNANLDAAGEAGLLAALRTLHARRTTVVVITHRPALLRDVDRVLVLHSGAVAAFGARAEVLGRFARVATPQPPLQRTQAG